jgi:hypothetical protein
MSTQSNKFRELLAINEGLQHKTNKTLFQKKSYFGGLSEALLEQFGKEVLLAKLIRNTADSARTNIRQSYAVELSRKITIPPEDEESRLERVIWLRWKIGEKKTSKSRFLPQCPHVVTYQLPLFNKKVKGGWGCIDLLGLSPDDLTPIVIELKKSESGESPLRMLLEATAYTIALREAWNFGLRNQWRDTLESLALAPDEKAKLNQLPIELKHGTAICLAPVDFWKSCAPDSCKQYSKDAWRQFSAVQTHLENVWGIRTILAECFLECRAWSPNN